MPIVVSLDIAFNPLANIKCLVPNTRQLLYPGILKYEARLLLFPIPNPFPGVFFDSLKRPVSLNFGVYPLIYFNVGHGDKFTKIGHLLE